MILRRIAKTVTALSAVGIVGLWAHLAARAPGPPGMPVGPLPEDALPPVLVGVAIFTALAVSGAVAAFRRVPLVVILCGTISLVPVGVFTLFLPWPHRFIGLLDAGMIVAGVVLLRSGEGGGAEPPRRGPTPPS
ncbi:MAG: hypothetical protein PVI57_03140 [Gemmatimonadota bacterium]|jgi:hypothetical protein